jgi:hypothetical protein
LEASVLAALKINSALEGSDSRNFGEIKPAISRHIPPLQNNSGTHSLCNCWNSVAVLFELRCSEFELGCSESAGQPQDQGRRATGSFRVRIDVQLLVLFTTRYSLGTLVRRREMFLRKIEQLWTYTSPPKMLELMGNVSKTETQVSCRVVGS